MRKILKIVDLSTGFGDLTMPHRRTGNFFAGGGGGGGSGKPFAQKILESCQNFYEAVRKKRGPYDVTT